MSFVCSAEKQMTAEPVVRIKSKFTSKHWRAFNRDRYLLTYITSYRVQASSIFSNFDDILLELHRYTRTTRVTSGSTL